MCVTTNRYQTIISKERKEYKDINSREKDPHFDMASPTPSSVKSEPADGLYSSHEPNLSYTSAYDTSIENTLPSQTDELLPASSSIYIDSPNFPSDEAPFDLLQGFSAPTLPVYINMGVNDHPDDVTFAGPVTTANIPLSRSLATIDVDHISPSMPTQRHSHHHHHHFPHHAQNRNRYPYLQKPVNSKALHRTEAPRTSLDSLSYYEQRPAFRRSYFALRRQRIPKAPPMPKHLFPGYMQSRTATSTNEIGGDDNEDEDDDEDQPPSKSLWIILRLVFFFFAIEFMYAVETALTVPILTALRVPESFYSMAWLISPILGFFLQPIVGMWSDTCKCRWGRRRPFILAFAIGAYIGVALLLNSSDLGVLFGDTADKIPYKAIVLTAIGVTLLDFCADSADAPIRAYLIDTTNPSDQERGFNIHAILGGFGGGIGFIVGAIDWPYVPMFTSKGGEFSVIFYFATFLFIVCSISTLTSVREEPLISSSSSSRDNGDTGNGNDDDEQPEIEVDEKRPLLSLRRNGSRAYTTTNKADRTTANLYLSDLSHQEGFIEIDPATGRQIPHDHVENTNEDMLLQTLERSHQVVAASMANIDSPSAGPVPTQAFEAELKQKAKLVKLGLMRRPASEETDDDDEKDNVTIKSMLISMVRMPPQLWKLMICQVIGWIGYFATHLYFTDFIATTVYNGTFEEKDPAGMKLYKQGVTMGCWGLFLYSASSAVYAFCLERWLSEKFSLKTLYFVGYFVYAIGCIVNYFVHYIAVNIAMCVTFGMLVVSLNTLPYHMLSKFHADDTYRNRDGTKRGIGVDCSLLNSCYFLGELIVAVSLGPLLERTGVDKCMFVGAGFALLGNVSMFFLFYFKKK